MDQSLLLNHTERRRAVEDVSRFMVDYIPDMMFRRLFGLLMMYVALRFLMSSAPEALIAVAGVVAVALGWVAFLFMRALGRRHLVPPSLPDEIRRMQQEGRGDPDYYI